MRENLGGLRDEKSDKYKGYIEFNPTTLMTCYQPIPIIRINGIMKPFKKTSGQASSLSSTGGITRLQSEDLDRLILQALSSILAYSSGFTIANLRRVMPASSLASIFSLYSLKSSVWMCTLKSLS